MSEKLRRNFSPQEKVSALRRYLVEKTAPSQVCDDFKIRLADLYRWQAELLEKGEMVFEHHDRAHQKAVNDYEKKIAALEAKLRQKDEVLVEMTGEFVKLKKKAGEN